MCLLTGVVRVLNWLGIRMQKMKEKMVVSPHWLVTAPAAAYYVCLSFWVAGKHVSVPELLVSLLNFNGEGTDWDSTKKACRGNVINYYLELRLKDCEKEGLHQLVGVTTNCLSYVSWVASLATQAFLCTFRFCTCSEKY